MKFVTNAWNYFPHRLLDGKSPKEMRAEYNNTAIQLHGEQRGLNDYAIIYS